MILFSIIIATHNRSLELAHCLQTVVSQSYRSFEVLISHSGVDDGTASVVEEFKSKLPILLFFENLPKGAARQRNEVINRARGEWIFFLDDDVRLQPDFFFQINAAISKKPDIGGISGRISNQYSLPLNIVSRLFLGFSGGGFSSYVNGKIKGPVINFLPYKDCLDLEEIDWMPTCVCGYKKEVLLETGFFPEFFQEYSLGEDIFLSMKVKERYKLIFARNAVLYHNYLGGTSAEKAYSIAVMQIYNRMYVLKTLRQQANILNLVRLLFWNIANSFINLVWGHKNVNIWWSSLRGYLVGFVKSREFL